jgi:proteasome lid subunit RPN8/RPN11
MSMAEKGRLWLRADCAEKIRADGVKTYPHECCGALLGRDLSPPTEANRSREIMEVFPLVNLREDSPQNRFSISPRDVIEAEKTARAHGLEVVGWYHSHPDHSARPSEYDREHAWPWYSYIILSVANGEAREMKSWRLQEDRTRYVEEEVHEGKEATHVKEVHL